MNITVIILYPIATIYNFFVSICILGYITYYYFNGVISLYKVHVSSNLIVTLLFYLLQIAFITIISFIGYVLCIAVTIIVVGCTMIISCINCIVLQSILWPIVDTLKSYCSIHKIIDEYYYQLKQEYILLKKQRRNIINSDNEKTTKDINGSIIIKSFVSNESNNKDNNNNNNNILNYLKRDSLSTKESLSIIIGNRKSSISSFYFQNNSIINLLISHWKFSLKESFISCSKWWFSVFKSFYGYYILTFPIMSRKITKGGYEGYRFFFWHHKTVIERPKFYENYLVQ
ncbi:hypothetical protein BCR32DRAFT_300965 [Anaeromyces robustus]|uniref:Uncharacterized protein n=1 Tax=Anaeromyces robustus TaxID=1754192 RepID=A0A1Y1X0H1_9FUNG|nr:hypothetical protein BCR32DRAFT_300965 [Anaeromyces robustus]|eukprot:ORX79317.1 hypothetical protein BCR32DRAFT_300965 [Anaeromyces robustus]